MKSTLTYKQVMAAGQDAGNRSMKKAGRTSWNEEDWNAAAELVAGLNPSPVSPPQSEITPLTP